MVVYTMNEVRKSVFFKRKDLVIITALALAIAFSFLLNQMKSGESGRVVVVSVDGKVVLETNKPGEYPIYRNGKRITTLVFDGKRAKVVHSTCPLKICEKMGWIEPGGEIICVPNHMVVRFKRSRVDAVTW